MFRVVVTPQCRAQLEKLKDDIAARNSRRVASNYLSRLKSFIADLAMAPYRGEHRDGIRFDQRSIGFERRVSVIFEVDEQKQIVNVAGIRYAGQQLNTDTE